MEKLNNVLAEITDQVNQEYERLVVEISELEVIAEKILQISWALQKIEKELE